MVEITSKKGVHRIRSRLQTKVVIEVVEPIEEEEEERSLVRVTYNVTIVKNMAILPMSVLQARKIKKMMQSWQNKMMNICS